MPARIKFTEDYLLIDMGYYTFKRFHALKVWWKHAHKDEPLQSYTSEPMFVDKFRTLYRSSIEKLAKKKKIRNDRVILALDCPHANIWRTQLFPTYKHRRHNIANGDVGSEDGEGEGVEGDDKQDEVDDIKAIFKIAKGDLLQELERDAGFVIMKEQNCEADDIIAQFILNKPPVTADQKFYIVATDTDYMQICDGEQVFLIDSEGKDLTKKHITEHHDKYLLRKILVGDATDDIPAVCMPLLHGSKKMTNTNVVQILKNEEECIRLMKYINIMRDDCSRLFDGSTTLQEQMHVYVERWRSEIVSAFILNTWLIDFRMLPQDLKRRIIKQIR